MTTVEMKFNSLFREQEKAPRTPRIFPDCGTTIVIKNCKCPKCGRLGLSVDGWTHECRFKTCKYFQVWSPFKPPLEIIRQVDPDYDTEVYRTEIRKALAHVREYLKGSEGQKDFEDLKQVADFEIWKATKRYGSEMNAKLAYTIADKQARRFLKILIEEPAGMREFPKDEDGKALPAVRLSFQDQKLTDDGEELAASEAEVAVLNKYGTPEEAPDYAEAFALCRPQLEQLVRSWFGTKRLVGEALLKDITVSVRGIPGVPKSTAARVQKIVLEEFKSLIAKGVVK